MKLRVRPEQIDEILKALDDSAVTTELKTYIADLEAKQPDRPSRVTRCLEEVALHHSTEAIASLEAYLSELEAHQQPVTSLQSRPDPDNPPRWSHQRSVEREQRRRGRALRKQENYR